MKEYTPDKKNTSVEKRASKIVTGPVKTKQKSELSKVASTFIAEDVSSVKDYIIWDVLIPAAKNTILDIIIDSANMFFGGSKNRKSNNNNNYNKVSYRSCYTGSENSRPAERKGPVMRYSMLDITLPNRGEAEKVIRQMRDSLEEYGEVSVGDLYDFCGIDGDFTDYKYGWANLDSARAERVRDGYRLDLPKIIPLNK